MTTSIYRRVLAAALLAALVVPFQNCGSKSEDLGTYVNNSSTSPAITAVPVVVSISTPVTIDALTSTALSVVAKGEEPLTYQWYKDGGSLEGQTASVLAIVEPLPNPVTASSSIATYKVVVTDVNGDTVTSSDIPVTVKKTAAQLAAVPAITGFTVNGTQVASFQRPTCQTNSNQSNFTIGVIATGSRLSYSWKVTYARNNGLFYTDILSTNAAVLTPPIYPIFDFNTGVYYCRLIFGGTYNVVVTDIFGRTATQDFIVSN